MNSDIVKVIKVIRFENDRFYEIQEKVINEIVFKIFINNQNVQNIITINDDLEYLCYGSLFLGTDLDINSILNNIKIYDDRCDIVYNKLDYNLNCCCESKKGFHRKSLIENIDIGHVIPDDIFKMHTIFYDRSEIFKQTAGIHGAGIFDQDCNLLYFAKDIARHNCISKICGFLIKNSDNIAKTKYIFLSCRINSEILKMISKIGISYILTKSSVSYQAIKECKNVRLIGFIRENRFTIFS